MTAAPRTGCRSPGADPSNGSVPGSGTSSPRSSARVVGRSSGLTSTSRALEPSDGPTTPALHEVHEPSGLGEPDPQLALQHRGRAELDRDHQLGGLEQQVEVVADVLVDLSLAGRCRGDVVAVARLQLLGLTCVTTACDLGLGDPRPPGCASACSPPSGRKSASPWPTSFSAPGWSRMTRESARLDVANASRVGTLALISPVTTSTDGPLGREHEVDAGGAGQLRDPHDRVLDVARCHHHQVGELVDDDEQVRVRRDDPLAARGRLHLAGPDRLVEVVDVPEAERPRGRRSASPSRARPTAGRPPPSWGW